MGAPHFDICTEKDINPPLHKASSPVPEIPENADKKTVRNILDEYNLKHEIVSASGKSDAN